MALLFYGSTFLWINLFLTQSFYDSTFFMDEPFYGSTFFLAEFFYDSTICWLNCLKNFTVDFNFFFVLENKFHYCTLYSKTRT